jgi:hypothetical protein
LIAKKSPGNSACTRDRIRRYRRTSSSFQKLGEPRRALPDVAFF